MAISNQQQQQFTRTQRTFVPLDQLPQGSGASGTYQDDVTGILVGIEPREGSYQITDRRTGQVISRPNSWTAHFADGAMFSWPTYLDEQGVVRMWSRFDSTINLAACVQQGIPIHIWRDERKFVHLELAQQPAQQVAPQYQPPMNPGLPW